MAISINRRNMIGALASAPILMAAKANSMKLLFNGKIYTGESANSIAEAVLIKNNRIIATGEFKQLSKYGKAELIDLKGNYAFPGFTDSHAHVLGIGMREFTLDLSGTKSIADLQARLKVWADKFPEGPIQGDGWIETHWPEKRFPTKEDIDAIVPDRPVFLIRADGHAGIANTKALELAKIDAKSPNPEGGEIARDKDGIATGMLIDNAMGVLDQALPKPSEKLKSMALVAANKTYAARGWVGIHCMSASQSDWKNLRQLDNSKQLKLRHNLYFDLGEASELLKTGYKSRANSRLVKVSGVKLYADGALGSRGAELLEPYSDKEHWTGLEVMSLATLKSAVNDAKKMGVQIATHAIGDRANRNVLKLYGETLGKESISKRWRIEHAQIISPDDIPQFGKMGVIASMQPSHAIGDLYFAPSRLGKDRLAGAYAWKALLKSGAHVCGGSDAPVEKGDPLIEFYAASYRHSMDGYADENWCLDQAVSRFEALKLFTQNAALAIFKEHEQGFIKPGYLADISVFSKDLMTIPAPEILKARAVMTIVDGDVVFDARMG